MTGPRRIVIDLRPSDAAPLPSMRACARCGVHHDRQRQSYCLQCQRENQKAYRARTVLGDKQRLKDSARSYAGVMKRRGKIIPQPCRKCGEPKAQMHHHDYGRPTDVEWLCNPCHLAWHKFWLARVKDIFSSWVLIDDQKVTAIVKHETSPDQREAS